MQRQRAFVERVVRRPDDRDGGRADLGRVLRERNRLGRGLRAAVHRDVERVRRGRDEELGRPPALVLPQQDSLAGRPEREDPVEAAGGQILDVRLEHVLVQRLSPSRSGVSAAASAPFSMLRL